MADDVYQMTGQNYANDGSFFGAIPALGQGISNWFTGDLDYARNVEFANANYLYSAQEAQKNRDWQEMMSNTQYQRAVKDLEAAGLNPYLAYQQGGAGTPSGSVANASGHSTGSPNGFGQLVSAMLGGLFKLTAQSMANNSDMQRTLIQANNARDIAYHKDDHWLQAQVAREFYRR